MLDPLPPLGPILARAYAGLAKGLTLVSESDYPYRAWSGALAPDAPLTRETLRPLLRIGPRYEPSLVPAAGFFERNQSPDSHEPDIAARYRLLQQVMDATLTELQAIYVRGPRVVRVRFFLLGRAADGSLAGLRSLAIET